MSEMASYWSVHLWVVASVLGVYLWKVSSDKQRPLMNDTVPTDWGLISRFSYSDIQHGTEVDIFSL